MNAILNSRWTPSADRFNHYVTEISDLGDQPLDPWNQPIDQGTLKPTFRHEELYKWETETLSPDGIPSKLIIFND